MFYFFLWPEFKQDSSTWVSLRRFKDCHGVITEVDAYDKNAFLVDRTVSQHFPYKSQHIAHQTLPRVEEKKLIYHLAAECFLFYNIQDDIINPNWTAIN